MSTITFRATDEQIKTIMANACNASTPMGMGRLHYDASEEFKPDDFNLSEKDDAFLDYVQGRMVKLLIKRLKDGNWSMRNEVREDYQSWCRKYPTAFGLVESAGITEFVERD